VKKNTHIFHHTVDINAVRYVLLICEKFPYLQLLSNFTEHVERIELAKGAKLKI